MQIDKEKYKIWQLPDPMLLHWIINPGLAFNEIVLGQRLPKITLIDKTSDAPLMERQYVPCSECHAIHDARLWSKGNAFGNWFGYICPTCHGKIPCLWNITSLLLLCLTFPIWIWFKESAEQKCFEKQKRRFSVPQTCELPKATPTSWLKMASIFALGMFVFILLFELWRGHLTASNIALGLGMSVFAGAFFGLGMKLVLGSKSK